MVDKKQFASALKGAADELLERGDLTAKKYAVLRQMELSPDAIERIMLLLLRSLPPAQIAGMLAGQLLAATGGDEDRARQDIQEAIKLSRAISRRL